MNGTGATPANWRTTVPDFFDAFLPAILICFMQAVAMFSYTVLFLSSERAASFVFQKLHFFYDYIPILYRYDIVHTSRGHLGDVRSLFAIDLFNAILQFVVLIVLGLILYRKTRGMRPNHLSLKLNVVFFSTLLFCGLTPLLTVFFGLEDVGLTSGVFSAMLTVPVFNGLLYFVIYARFWERYAEKWLGRQRVAPVDDAIRQTDSER